MEFNNLKITISRSDDKVELVFNELDNLSVNLSDSGVEDVKQLFDKVFDYIIAPNINISSISKIVGFSNI